MVLLDTFFRSVLFILFYIIITVFCSFVLAVFYFSIVICLFKSHFPVFITFISNTG